MIIYYSIFAYTCIIAFVGCMIQTTNRKKALIYDYQNEKEKQKNEKSIGLFFAVVSFILLVFFIGMRTRYADTAAYIGMFDKMNPNLTSIKSIYNNDSDAIGFNALMWLFKKYISKDVSAWLMFLAIYQGGAIVSVFYKYSCDYLLSAFLFIASVDFSYMMNGIRQFLAVCLILYFFSYVVEKKTIKFILIVIIASTIHTTALIWIPVYFLVQFRPWSTLIWSSLVVTLLAVLGINQIAPLLESSLESTKYANVDIMSMDDGVNIIRVIISAVPALLAFVRRKQMQGKTDKSIDICINLSVLCICIYLVGMVTSGILIGRFPIYFTILNYILLPWLFKNAFKGNTGTLLKYACYVLYFAYFYYVMVIQGFGLYESSILGLYYYD